MVLILGLMVSLGMMVSYPFFMIYVILLSSIVLSIYMYMVYSSFWCSYILMLVMVSGMLVLVSFIVSMTFDKNYGFSFYGSFIFMGLLLYEVFSGSFYVNMNNMSVYWNSFVSMSVLFMLGLLFFLMLVVVWYGSLDSGPLRVND